MWDDYLHVFFIRRKNRTKGVFCDIMKSKNYSHNRTVKEAFIKMKIKEMIVVEGKDDTVAIQQALEADTIETGGSAINQDVISRIRLAQEKRGVIIFTDPDYPGERIRHIISQAVPGCKHAFLTRDKAVSKKGKFGIEHASSEDIRAALEKVKTENYIEAKEEVSWADLVHMGLIGGSISQRLRDVTSAKLGIGHCNGKQFYKRLIAFQITKEELEQAYQESLQEVEK